MNLRDSIDADANMDLYANTFTIVKTMPKITVTHYTANFDETSTLIMEWKRYCDNKSATRSWEELNINGSIEFVYCNVEYKILLNNWKPKTELH